MTNVEKLTELGIIGDVRQRLGADDENFTDKDVKDFADILFDVANKATAGHMVEPENIDEEKAKSFEQWVEKQRKDS